MGMTDIERRALKGGATLPDLAELPVRVPRDRAAELLRKHFFDVSPRTLERAPLRWLILNGKAHVETAELFAYGASVVAAAPVLQGGKRTARSLEI